MSFTRGAAPSRRKTLAGLMSRVHHVELVRGAERGEELRRDLDRLLEGHPEAAAHAVPEGAPDEALHHEVRLPVREGVPPRGHGRCPRAGAAR